MGTSSLAANLDGKVIHCTYLRSIETGESTYPVDLSIIVKHQYVTSANIANELVLEQFIIPKEYLETTGLMGVSDVDQTLEFHVINLRYLDNLYIEAREVRDGAPILTRVPVLIGDDDVDALPSNPEKYPEHDENRPEVIPEMNISVHNTDSGILYLIQNNELVPIQSSKRIVIQEENGEQNFIQLDYNEVGSSIFIENSFSNLIPNPQFSGSEDVPDQWEIDAPGMVLNSYLVDGEIANTKIWRIRASNTNIFNAFNHVTLSTTDKHDIYSGLKALTFSMYYKVNCESKNIPFSSFKAKINFYFNDDLIRSESIDLAISEDVQTWILLGGSLTGSQIPLSANKYSLELDIVDIVTTELFNVDIYLPQLEPSTYATTRILDAKIQDRFVTGTIFELKPPFYILVKTHYIPGTGIRGLFSSTTNQVAGFEFLASSDHLGFKQYDANGNMLANFASNLFPPININAVITYGLWVTDSGIEFYFNGNLLSSHSCPLVINQNKRYIVGSLEKSNTTINTELLDFKILRYKP